MPQSQPNYLTVAPDGSVTASFSGGVIVPLSGSIGASPGRSIAWVDANGAKLAYVVGTQVGAQIENHQVAATQDASIATVNYQADSYVRANDTTNIAEVRASAARQEAPVQSFDKKILDANGSSDYLLKQAGYTNGNAASGLVAVPNDSVFRDVMEDTAGNILGRTVNLTVAGTVDQVFRVSCNCMFVANADIWVLVELAIFMYNNNTSTYYEVPGGRVRWHSYGTTNDTTRPQNESRTATGLVQIPATVAGYNYHPRAQIRCFGGLGGGNYSVDPTLLHLSAERVA